MLGTAGTIAAEIFVLTGHTAGMVGPAAVLTIVAAGVLSYSIALNYCELATTYPVTGGAMTYVREAYGNGLLSFLVGSLDCLSSTFYSALSAVGFAYSLRIFIPALPIVPTALLVAAAFTVLNLFGVTNVGNLQIALGAVLLVLLGGYVIFGLASPRGFSMAVFVPDGRFFIHDGVLSNGAALLATAALIYNAYVGFEVLADDAEEIVSPDRNIPRGILISLTVIVLVYSSVALVTLGVVPWTELAGSETALTDAASRMVPRWGAAALAVAGIIATLTSVNTAMLSATREALTLSRDGAWPRVLSRLGRFRTPYGAVLLIGVLVSLVAALGVVDFLSYISSSGYLFVLFWSSLAMLRLRRLQPDIRRPFRVPLYPFTAYVAAGMCAVIVAFSAWQALAFGASVLGVLSLWYLTRRPLQAWRARHASVAEPAGQRILVPVANPRTAESLVRLASSLAMARVDTSLCLLTVMPTARHLTPPASQRLLSYLGPKQRGLLQRAAEIAQSRNAPVYTKLRAAPHIAQGILDELRTHGHDQLVLMGWPGANSGQLGADGPANTLLQTASTDVALFLDRGLQNARRILVPVGGGPHSRLALRLAQDLASSEGGTVTALYCCRWVEPDDLEDRLMFLREIVEGELGASAGQVTTRIVCVPSVSEGVLAETHRQAYDLLALGVSDEPTSHEHAFGLIVDEVVPKVACSVLLVRRHQPAPIAWVRRQAKRVEREPTP